jgi:uncharacterized protein
LWPLSQGETDSAADGFVDAVFQLDGSVRMPPCSLTKRDYVARALRGGYPEAVRRDPGRRRARFFDSYVSDLVARDVQQISEIERSAEMRRLLSVVAARMGTLAVVQSMANDIALPRQTLSRYLDLLGPLWRRGMRSLRQTAGSDFLLGDASVAALAWLRTARKRCWAPCLVSP